MIPYAHKQNIVLSLSKELADGWGIPILDYEVAVVSDDGQNIFVVFQHMVTGYRIEVNDIIVNDIGEILQCSYPELRFPN